jgi:hypothetical protein
MPFAARITSNEPEHDAVTLYWRGWHDGAAYIVGKQALDKLV